MGGSCSSDQSAPQYRRGEMQRMNPQRGQQFMRRQNFRNTHPDPRAQRYPPRLQQRYPPQVNRQRTADRAPVMRQPMRQPLPQRGRGMMMYNQGPPEERRPYYDGPSQSMGGRLPQVGRGSYSQNMGGRPPQMETIPQQGLPQMQMPPPQETIRQPQTMPPPQMITQPRMVPKVETMPFRDAASQPTVRYQPPAQNMEQVVTVQPITQETCSMNVAAPQPQNVAFQQEVLPIPKVITAPEPPPCPTDILQPDAYSSPQHSMNGHFVQQSQARYQPRFN